MFLDDNNTQPRKSNMVFSCGPNEEDRRTVSSKYYRKDEMDCHYYKLTAPVHVRLKDINNKMHLTAVSGPVVFVASGDDFWGGEKAKNYRSKVIENPTYRALMGAAQALQKATKDYHHSFIEGVTFKGYEGNVMILQMQFGS
jgi:hypothetical protein